MQHASFAKHPRDPSALCRKEGPSFSDSQDFKEPKPGPGTWDYVTRAWVSEALRWPGQRGVCCTRRWVLRVSQGWKDALPQSCTPPQPGDRSSDRLAPSARTARGQDVNATYAERLQGGDKRQRPSCPRPQSQDTPEPTPKPGRLQPQMTTPGGLITARGIGQLSTPPGATGEMR